jgi:hypothetical protein
MSVSISHSRGKYDPLLLEVVVVVARFRKRQLPKANEVVVALLYTGSLMAP